MSDYTPTRNEVLTALVVYRAIRGDDSPPSIKDIATSAEASQYAGEAESALAAIEREAAARALEEAAEIAEALDFGPAPPFSRASAHQWGARQAAVRIRARAAEMREGGR